jgi:ectoine hydroxylase-related dioxygenase (phytanoyl-CoA dioxygenase family)
MREFPRIDYTQHPAFRDLAQYPDELSAVLHTHFEETGLLVKEFDAQKEHLDEAVIRNFYSNTISPYVSGKIAPLIEEGYQGPAECKEMMLLSLGSFVSKMVDQSLYQNIKKGYQGKPATTASKKVYDELVENGITLSSIPAEAIEKFNREITPYKKELLEKGATQPHDRIAMGLPRRSAYWRIIEQYMETSGFKQGASAFYGGELVVTGCGLEYSNDQQTWWRDCYADKGLPVNRCVYMHNDYDYDYVKSLVYLTDVTTQTGPFCYIPESHHWTRPLSLSFYLKELEIALSRKIRSTIKGKDAYYRPAMKYEAGRKLFIAFPKIFHQLSHFGDDIEDGTALGNELLSKELQVTSEKGNFVFFTGGSGIHRGGTVYKGERWALQITLTREPGLKKKITSFSRRTTGALLAVILGEEKMLQIQKKYNTVI